VGVYVAMLRSINVSGRNRVAMADLRSLVEGLGYGDVATYVQSGNVVFTGTGASAAVAGRIADAITAELGLEVPVIVRNRRELSGVIGGVPYSGADDEPTLHHVTFLADRPSPASVTKLAEKAAPFAPDRCDVVGKDVYLHCPGGYGNTKLNNAFIERHLGVTATTRNWRTVKTLAEMGAERA
jgi:uncharacterized protein (DUF1697 family)